MPSSKYIDNSDEYTVRHTQKNQQLPRVIQDKSVVSFDQWCEQNNNHLIHIYSMLQEACRSSGRYIFDSETCDFHSFCIVAYTNSYKYKKNDTNYSSDDSYENDDTVVF